MKYKRVICTMASVEQFAGPIPEQRGASQLRVAAESSHDKPQRAVLLRGAGERSRDLSLIHRSIAARSNLDPRFLHSGAYGFVDTNLMHEDTPHVQDAIKAHADETGKPVVLIGHSWGARQATLAASTETRSFDPSREIQAVVSVTGAIGDLRGLPSEEDVRMVALYSNHDVVTHPYSPLPWLRPTNPEFHHHEQLPGSWHDLAIFAKGHMVPLYKRSVHDTVIKWAEMPPVGFENPAQTPEAVDAIQALPNMPDAEVIPLPRAAMVFGTEQSSVRA